MSDTDVTTCWGCFAGHLQTGAGLLQGRHGQGRSVGSNCRVSCHLTPVLTCAGESPPKGRSDSRSAEATDDFPYQVTFAADVREPRGSEGASTKGGGWTEADYQFRNRIGNNSCSAHLHNELKLTIRCVSAPHDIAWSRIHYTWQTKGSLLVTPRVHV